LGYDKVPTTLPPWHATKVTPNKYWPRLWQLKAVLQACGLFEVHTYSFVSRKQLDDFGYRIDEHLKLQNPMSMEQEYLRGSLLPSLVGVASRNVGYARRFGIFEVSRVFHPTSRGEQPDEPTYVAVLMRAESDLYREAKAVLDLLARDFNLSITISKAVMSQLHPARAAEIKVGKVRLGYIGEVHPDITASHKISGGLGYIELELDKLFDQSVQKTYKPLSKYPSVYRDLAIEVNRSVTWQDVRSTIEDSGQANPQFLNDYYGSEMAPDMKSMAIRLEMQSPEKTLTDQEADERVEKITGLVKQKFSASIR
jgi:phenylalanyl-tRNA synthetase beta chain